MSWLRTTETHAHASGEVFIAAQNGHTAALERLLAAGAGADASYLAADGAAPLFVAAQNGPWPGVLGDSIRPRSTACGKISVSRLDQYYCKIIQAVFKATIWA